MGSSLIGLVFIAILYIFLVPNELPLFVYPIILLFILIPFFIALKNIYDIQIDISEDEVCFTKATLFSKKSWKENLNEYEGVLKHTITKSSGNRSSTNTYHCLTLKNRHDGSKDIRLIEQLLEEGIRKIQESYAKALQIPVVEKAGEGKYIERDLEDLDKNVSTLIAEKKLIPTGYSQKPFPNKRLKYTDLKKGFMVDHFYGFGWPLLLGLLLFGGSIFLLYYAIAVNMGALPPGLIMLLMGLFISLSNLTRNYLLVSRNRIRTETRLFGRLILQSTVLINSVESIRLGYDTSGRKAGPLNIISDSKTLSYAQWGVAKEEQLWLYDKLVTFIKDNSI